MHISGEKIKNVRTCKKISRAELSRQSGIPVRTLEDWETGRRNPTNIDVIMQVAQALQISLSELYTDEYLSKLNAQALADMDYFADNDEEEMLLISKINNVYMSQKDVGLAKLIDRFISHTGVQAALKIVEDYLNESGIN